jgi:hypothetical protein
MLVDDHHDREATGNAGCPAPGSEMELTTWGDSPGVASDRQLWAEPRPQRFATATASPPPNLVAPLGQS